MLLALVRVELSRLDSFLTFSYIFLVHELTLMKVLECLTEW